jgi:hypothetical protein
MKLRSEQLLKEVLIMARQFHWSEKDILRLRMQRRRAYLTLLEQEADAMLMAELRGDQ